MILKLPFHHTLIGFIRLDDGRAFAAVQRTGVSWYSTHDVDAEGNCCTGHYDMARDEAIADMVARSRRRGALGTEV